MIPVAIAQRLRDQGVEISAPETIEIGDDVCLDAIQGPHTVLHAGTRLSGDRLVIMSGCILGAEGPVTVRNCALAERVSLGAGVFTDAVFLDDASMGLGAQVRAGCLLEEQASGAHTVGLKQTILLPFVTLGSLINACDILIAGGTSRRDHSEVGSSFVHFNFTPYGRHGDKATPSLVGDVPRGVMLRSPRVFLGGQGGLVGPLQIDYGTVLAAGFVYRRDHGPNELVVGETIKSGVVPFSPLRYGSITARVRKNLQYIGNLMALLQWYLQVRIPTASGQRLTVYRAVIRLLEESIGERIARLDTFAAYMDDSIVAWEGTAGRPARNIAARIAEQRHFKETWPQIKARLEGYAEILGALPKPDVFARGWTDVSGAPYLAAVQDLPAAAVESGIAWLDRIVARVVGLWTPGALDAHPARQ